MKRECFDLNGIWDWYLPGGMKQKRTVPSSYHCVGEAIFEKRFTAKMESSKRLYLCFDGIIYQGIVELNGKWIGTMLPYVGYSFDITDSLENGENLNRVRLKDISAPFGPSEGWKCFGGIIRDVYLELTDNVHIDDSQWITRFTNDFHKSACSLKISIQNPAAAVFARALKAELAYNGRTHYSLTRQVSNVDDLVSICFEFNVDGHVLWSPNEPDLYDLLLELSDPDDPSAGDRVSKKVSFRELCSQGTSFHLNGERIALKGVCRHDKWGDAQGFTLTEEQMEQDMQMIKHIGANYVRLVHYPHHKRIIDVADRIGLMVSDEPGLWWHDLADESIAGSTLEIIRRTVFRDRNHASVIFWLAFNECIFAGTYLARVRDLCRKLDPTRMVSGANYMNVKWTKDFYSQNDIDFYTFHPYGNFPYGLFGAGIDSEKPMVSLTEILSTLNDKPVIFTEWGGWPVHDNHALLRHFARDMAALTKQEAPEPNLAGFCYWEWSDTYQFSRKYPACVDGILVEGLVDVWRNKRVNYTTLFDIFTEMDYREVRKQSVTVYEGAALRSTRCQSDARNHALKNAASSKRANKDGILSGPVLEKSIAAIEQLPVRIADGLPLLLTAETDKIVVNVEKKAIQVHFLGHVMFSGGYPANGTLGDEIALYRLLYSDGSLQEIRLSKRLELTVSNLVWGPYRLNPSAANLSRPLTYTVDADWEIYFINYFVAETDRSKVLDRLIWSCWTTHMRLCSMG